MNRAAFVIYLSVLIWSVVFFGAVHTYAYTIAFLGIFLATLLVIVDNIRNDPRSGALELRILKTPLNPLFLAILCFLFLQTILLPDGILGIISSRSLVAAKAALPASADPAYQAASNGWSTLIPHTYPVRQSIIRWTAYGLLFWGLTQTLNSKKRIEIAVLAILITGLLEAMYGLAQAYSQSGNILWFSKSTFGSNQSATGTYINRNHFAGLMEMCLLLAIGFAVALAPGGGRPGGQEDSSTLRRRLSSLVSREAIHSKRTFVIFSGLAAGIGLIFSASRGGMLSIAAALLMWGLLLNLRRGRRRKGRIVLILLLLISTYALHIGVEYPLSRFRDIDTSYISRARYWKQALEIHGDYRIFGSGVGNFRYVHPGYQTEEDKGKLPRYAHNDWIQWLAEAGLAGLCTAIAGLVYCLCRILKQWRARSDPYAVSLGAVPLVVMTALGLHSMADFNLHIPANFMMLAAVTAVGYAALNLHRRHDEAMAYEYRSLNLRGAGVLVLIPAVVIFIWIGKATARHFVAEMYCNTVHNSTMNRDPAPPIREIEAAIDWDPANAVYRYKLAQRLMHERNGIPDTEDNARERRRRQFEIIPVLEEAVCLNPYNAEYHLRLGWEYTHFWREPDYREKWMKAADLSMSRAARFAGNANPWLHTQLGRYWTIRAASLAPPETRDNPLLHKALMHFGEAMDLEGGRDRQLLHEEIRTHVYWHFPDDGYVREAIESLGR